VEGEEMETSELFEDHKEAASGVETREILETPSEPMLVYTFNIEILRFWGLLGGLSLLLIGTFVTRVFVEFPEGSGGFDFEATYIYSLFHFNHTCTVLDFNPAKTVSAIVIMFHTVPMNLFIILSYYRVRHDYERGHVPRWLWLYTKITTPYVFIAMTYFYMVFVNSPIDKPSFILHYVPYMSWQIAMMLMAIRQCAHVSLLHVMPFNIPRVVITVYLGILFATGIFYTIFIWSFIAGNPIMDTTIASRRHFSMTLMYFFNLIAVIIPTIFSFIESRNGHTQTFHFFNNPCGVVGTNSIGVVDTNSI